MELAELVRLRRYCQARLEHLTASVVEAAVLDSQAVHLAHALIVVQLRPVDASALGHPAVSDEAALAPNAVGLVVLDAAGLLPL